MKKILIPLIIFILLIVIPAFFAYSWWHSNTKPVSGNENQVRFVIPKGKSASYVAQKLYENGLIRDPLAFKFYVQLTDRAKKIQAGEFELSPNLSLVEIVERLMKGPLELWVTVPEGLRREEVVEKFIEGLEMDSSQAAIFRLDFLKNSEELEGYLFPETYLFPRDIAAMKVVEKMKSVFDSKVTSEMQQKFQKNGLSLNETVTLASVIERETKTDEERPIVAGIFFNRLKADWPLQADATLQYGVANLKIGDQDLKLENYWEILTKEDLEINSPYNSYKFAGLPPTPIANPGFSSINSVANPQDNDYWYYIHDSEGKIHYSETLEEHNKNIRLYLGK